MTEATQQIPEKLLRKVVDDLAFTKEQYLNGCTTSQEALNKLITLLELAGF